MNVQRKKVFLILSIGIFLVSLVTFMFTPMTGDLHVLLAGSHQAEYIGSNWLYNAFNVWDLKGELYRLFLYVLYKFATYFVDFSTYYFEIVINGLFIVFVMLVVLLSIVLGEQKHPKHKKYLFTLGCSAFFATLGMAHIQAEMICVLILLLAFSIYNNSLRGHQLKNIKLLIVGMLIGSMFFFKSVIILMALSFWATINILRGNKGGLDRHDTFIMILGVFITIAIMAILILLVNPSEFRNMLDASVYQNTLISGASFSVLHILKTFSISFLRSLYGYPIVFVGTIIGLVSFINNIKKSEWNIAGFRFVAWGMPALIVILANCYFQYHYYLFAYISVIEVLLFKWHDDESFISNRLIIYSLIFITSCFMVIKIGDKPYSLMLYIGLSALVMGLLIVNELLLKLFNYKWMILVALCLTTVTYMSYLSVFSDNFILYNRLNTPIYDDNVNVISSIDKEQNIMYLDAGLGAYLLMNKSYLDEYYPLPIQRIYEGSKYESLPCHQTALKKALAFDGEYISVDEKWMFGDGYNVMLRDKIRKEYVDIGHVYVYSLNDNMFDKMEKIDNIYLTIYKKK